MASRGGARCRRKHALACEDVYYTPVVGLDRRPGRQRGHSDPVARELGGAQAELLDVLWHVQSATVPELVDAIGEKRVVAYTTVLTMVQRLYARGLLERVPEGRGFRYRPTRTREELLGDWSDELIDRLLGDFGEVAVARLDARLRDVGPAARERLREAAKKRP
jgi:predicted transcriptional regulator